MTWADLEGTLSKWVLHMLNISYLLLSLLSDLETHIMLCIKSYSENIKFAEPCELQLLQASPASRQFKRMSFIKPTCHISHNAFSNLLNFMT